jgi:hypothetical protein
MTEEQQKQVRKRVRAVREARDTWERGGAQYLGGVYTVEAQGTLPSGPQVQYFQQHLAPHLTRDLYLNTLGENERVATGNMWQGRGIQWNDQWNHAPVLITPVTKKKRFYFKSVPNATNDLTQYDI